MSETSELLRKAHRLIERCGWWQGDYYPPGNDWRNTRACPSGALYIAAGHDPQKTYEAPLATHWLVSEAVNELQSILDRRGYPYALTTWNDEWQRNRDEVLELLATAADEAAETGTRPSGRDAAGADRPAAHGGRPGPVGEATT